MRRDLTQDFFERMFIAKLHGTMKDQETLQTVVLFLAICQRIARVELCITGI